MRLRDMWTWLRRRTTYICYHCSWTSINFPATKTCPVCGNPVSTVDV